MTLTNQKWHFGMMFVCHFGLKYGKCLVEIFLSIFGAHMDPGPVDLSRYSAGQLWTLLYQVLWALQQLHQGFRGAPTRETDSEVEIIDPPGTNWSTATPNPTTPPGPPPGFSNEVRAVPGRGASSPARRICNTGQSGQSSLASWLSGSSVV